MRILFNKAIRVNNKYFTLNLTQLDSDEGVIHIVNSNLPDTYVNELVEELNTDTITKNNSPDTMALKAVRRAIENWKQNRPISKYCYWDSILEEYPEILKGKFQISTKLLYSKGWKYLYGEDFNRYRNKAFTIPSYVLSTYFLEAYLERPNYIVLSRIYRPTFEKEIGNVRAGNNYVEIYSKSNQFYRLRHLKKDLHCLIAIDGEFTELQMAINQL